MKGKPMPRPILIITQPRNGALAPVARELIACARRIGAHRNAPVCLAMAGDDPSESAEKIARETGLDVFLFQGGCADDPPGFFWMGIGPDALMEINPSYICMAHDAEGSEIAPALAIRLGAGCIIGVENIVIQDDRLCFTRKIFGGKICAVHAPESDMTVLTIMPGMFAAGSIEPEDARPPGRVRAVRVSLQPRAVQHLGYRSELAESANLKAAEVIVAAGNGTGKKENLDIIFELAGLFARSAVAGSRPVCDKKWLPLNRQVGVTGATVSPKLYIACGISGAEQHLAGMKTADLIVAVNTDSHAAIFRASDICIIEDLTTFIPLFIDTCRNN
jgi:electron transfer flavoprotein alpha subunit